MHSSQVLFLIFLSPFIFCYTESYRPDSDRALSEYDLSEAETHDSTETSGKVYSGVKSNREDIDTNSESKLEEEFDAKPNKKVVSSPTNGETNNGKKYYKKSGATDSGADSVDTKHHKNSGHKNSGQKGYNKKQGLNKRNAKEEREQSVYKGSDSEANGNGDIDANDKWSATDVSNSDRVDKTAKLEPEPIEPEFTKDSKDSKTYKKGNQKYYKKDKNNKYSKKRSGGSERKKRSYDYFGFFN